MYWDESSADKGDKAKPVIKIPAANKPTFDSTPDRIKKLEKENEELRHTVNSLNYRLNQLTNYVRRLSKNVDNKVDKRNRK